MVTLSFPMIKGPFGASLCMDLVDNNKKDGANTSNTSCGWSGDGVCFEKNVTLTLLDD